MRRPVSPPPLPKQHRDGSRTWRTKDLTASLQWLADLLPLQVLAAEQVIVRACRDSEGPVSPSMDGSSGRRYEDDGSRTGQTPNRVLAKNRCSESSADRWVRDPVVANVESLVGAVVGMRELALRAQAALSALNALDPEEARKLVEAKPAERGQFCENPNHEGRWVAGGSADPIRSGRCGACAQQYRRTGKDRDQEMIARAEGRAA